MNAYDPGILPYGQYPLDTHIIWLAEQKDAFSF